MMTKRSNRSHIMSFTETLISKTTWVGSLPCQECKILAPNSACQRCISKKTPVQLQRYKVFSRYLRLASHNSWRKRVASAAKPWQSLKSHYFWMVWVPKAMKKSESLYFCKTLACLKVRGGRPKSFQIIEKSEKS